MDILAVPKRNRWKDSEGMLMTDDRNLPGAPTVLPHRLLKKGGDHHPIVLAEARRRASSIQLRAADAITAFAGSMRFVYLHAVVFGLWMIFWEPSPWPSLTLVVSLEAIFLSTFVMIGQNRQAAFQQAKADHDFALNDKELLTNTELTRRVHELTLEIHAHVVNSSTTSKPV
jgi:uncharacterized membrane protein